VKQFTDASGKCWTITADVNAMRRVKDLAGVDLLDGAGLAKVTAAGDLWAVLELWPNVLWAFCLPQIQEAKPPITPETWAELLLADRLVETERVPVFESAVTATLEELTLFFRKLGRKTAATALEKILQTRTTEETNLAQRTASLLDRTIQEELTTLERTLAEQLTPSTRGSESTSSPESSESIQAP